VALRASIAGFVVAVVLACASPAAARCVSQTTPRWTAHQQLVLLLDPTGAEHNLRIGLCLPLFDTTESVLDQNHVELGVVSYVSPIYAAGGAYAQLAPATFWFARVEVGGIGVWPLPLDGAGYFPLSGYGARYGSADLPASAGQTASGWGARFLSVFRGRIDLAPLEDRFVYLAALDALFADYADIGSAPFYAMIRHDVVAAQHDWIVGNEAILITGIPIPGGPDFRIGAYSALRSVPAAGYVGHQVGGIVMLTWERPLPGLEEISLFIRVGGYTNHAFRTGEPATMASASADHDLGGP
jgi:hypothetical protein